MSKKLKQINEKKAILNNKLLEADKRLEEIYEEKNKILKAAEEEAKKIISNANQKIE